ncbi:MAG: hypothetical protein C4B59_12710 [Candidatus Methanogaster sp.]|uniref:Uncharacterized protein n=1 Tax=Candidatus Methanogaster sp. TaxID=3386292 RepID=A0AC61L0M2_9EURY|nr:MAG: hypothetical protein C4B59_12710 [ANME-2 cluster archaeon]
MIHDPAITSRYVCAGVHDGAGFRPRVLHESVKRVGVDLVMGSSHGKYIADDGGLAFARVGFAVYGRITNAIPDHADA